MRSTETQNAEEPNEHAGTPLPESKPLLGRRLLLPLYGLVLALMGWSVVRFDLPDSLLLFLVVPCVLAAFTYPRAVILTMIGLLTITAWWVTRIVSPDPQSSRVTIIVTVFSTTIAAEAVRAMAKTRAKLQRSREMILFEGSFLADAGVDLIACDGEEAVFKTIVDFLSQLSLDALIIVNQATADQRYLVTRSIIGLPMPLLNKAEELTGFTILGKPSVIVDAYRDVFFQNRLKMIPGGFAALAASEIPLALGKLFETLFGFHDVYTIGIADPTVIYGNVHIITRDPTASLPCHIIESFIYQCFMTLSRISTSHDLAASEEKYRLLFRNMSAGFALHEIIRDKDGHPCDYRFLEANAAFEEATGLDAGTIIGKTVLELLPQTERAWIETYGRVVDTGEPARIENYSQSLDRTYEVVAYRSEAERFATVFYDVTERRRDQAALQAAHDELESRVRARTSELQAQVAQAGAILSSVRDAIFLTDADRRILYANPAFTTLTGYAPEQITGMSIEVLADVMGSADTCPLILAALDRSSSWQGDVVCHRKDGRPYDATLTAAPVRDASGTVTGYVFSQHDISRQKSLMQARDQFITNVSHQFRTPVTTLKLLIHLMLRSELSDGAQRQLQAMAAQTEWLSQLIADTVDLIALDSGKAAAVRDSISIPMLVEDAVRRHEEESRKSGIALTAAPLPADLPVVVGDGSRLAHALDKVLSNAIRYTPQGGSVQIAVTRGEREGKGLAGDTWVGITVRDTGPGIPADEQDQVFERFFRGRVAEAGDTHGTGLGLSIAQQILTAHGGDITLETEPGKGSAFTLWLPGGRGVTGG